jgi:hypothetical protein
MTDIVGAAICAGCGAWHEEYCIYPACDCAPVVPEMIKTALRAALPWDLPAERLEAMARAMYERGPMFKHTGLAWDAFPDYLADRRAVYIADALAAYRADPIMRELYPETRAPGFGRG